MEGWVLKLWKEYDGKYNFTEIRSVQNILKHSY